MVNLITFVKYSANLNFKNLKPFGIAVSTESAALQGACGSILQLCTLRLASSANSTIAQFRLKNKSTTDSASDLVRPVSLLRAVMRSALFMGAPEG